MESLLQWLSVSLAGISQQLKGLWVSMELGQPYFIKPLGMCNLALPLLGGGGRKKKIKEWANRAETSPTEEKGSSGQDIAHTAWAFSHSQASPSLPAPSLFPVKLGRPQHSAVTHPTAAQGRESGHTLARGLTKPATRADTREALLLLLPPNMQFFPQIVSQLLGIYYKQHFLSVCYNFRN